MLVIGVTNWTECRQNKENFNIEDEKNPYDAFSGKNFYELNRILTVNLSVDIFIYLFFIFL